MHAHIGKMIDYRKSLGEEDPLDPKITGQMMDRFKEILEIGKKEYEDVPANAYYRDGYNLWKRMYEKPDDYTLFLTDKSIPATNNAALYELYVIRTNRSWSICFQCFAA